jgi:hypothetical protein
VFEDAEFFNDFDLAGGVEGKGPGVVGGVVGGDEGVGDDFAEVGVKEKGINGDKMGVYLGLSGI